MPAIKDCFIASPLTQGRGLKHYKLYLCIGENMYFIINTDPCSWNYIISAKDCSILKYDSYLNCGSLRSEPIRDFEIIKKEQLPKHCIEAIIDKVRIVPTLPPYQKRDIIASLESVL